MATGQPFTHCAFLQLMQREASSIASSLLYPRHTSLKLVARSFASCSLTGILFNTSILFNHAFLIYRIQTFAVELLAIAAATVMGISLFQG